MKLHVLGAHSLPSRTTQPTALLIDRVLALDAGSIASGLTFEEQHEVQAVLLSHRHFDHVRDLVQLANATRDNGRTVDVFGNRETLDAIKKQLMDGDIYTDFTVRPSPEKPKLCLHPVEVRKPFSALGYSITALPVKHKAPALGYVVEGPDGRRVLYTGDLGGGLEHFGDFPSAHLIVTEVDLSNRYEADARTNGHYTPAILGAQLEALRARWGTLPPVLAVHFTAWLEEEIREELLPVEARLGVNITAAHEGMVLWV